VSSWRNSVEPECSQVLVLLSGGIDSAACARYYQAGGYSVEALFIDYGQAARVMEFSAATKVARDMDLPLMKVEVTGLPPLMGNIRGRNATLLCLALTHFQYPCGMISLGIHAGTPYEDCSPAFVRNIQAVFDIYSDGRIRLDSPFLMWSKAAVWEYGNKEGIPVHLTYSCETGSEPPCGNCSSCRDVEALRAS
jgi:7-cyano-7-deazaguanine synthase